VFKVNASLDQERSEKELYIPYWALTFEEMMRVTFGEFSNEKDRSAIIERVQKYKESTINKYPKAGVTKDSVNVDSPIPFSINQMWYELWNEVFLTYYSKDGKKPTEDNWAYEIDEGGNPMKGDPETAQPPRFRPPKNVKEDDEKINYGHSTLNIRSQLEALGSKLRLPRYRFLFSPGGFKPDLDGNVQNDLDDLLKDWVGSGKPVTILDLSGVPIDILNTMIGVLLRILYEGLFWGRRLSQGGRFRPLLVVMEEAHNYLNDETKGMASKVVQRIVKEGRKYGIGAMIVSQRPSEVNATILSQCGTFVTLRLSNTADRGRVNAALPENMEGLTGMLPILKTGEAIVFGESVKLPMRTYITPPPLDRRPDSQDPIVYDEIPQDESMYPGGWGVRMEENPNYSEMLEVWRSQNPFPSRISKKEKEDEQE
jgi:hypothetical protein